MRPPFQISRSFKTIGFSLIEVVLAMGIFLVTILALVGLLGPTLKSVKEVENIDEVASVVNTLNAFLQNSPGIATFSSSKFNVIYGNVVTEDQATIFVFQAYRDGASIDTILKVGFASGENVGDNSARVTSADFNNAAGTIYRCVLTASSVTPLTPKPLRSETRNENGIYTLTSVDVATYPEGYLALEVRIFAEEPPAPSAVFSDQTDLVALANEEPIFTYNTAIVR